MLDVGGNRWERILSGEIFTVKPGQKVRWKSNGLVRKVIPMTDVDKFRYFEEPGTVIIRNLVGTEIVLMPDEYEVVE